jgi:hypothetical protein
VRPVAGDEHWADLMRAHARVHAGRPIVVESGDGRADLSAVLRRVRT